MSLGGAVLFFANVSGAESRDPAKPGVINAVVAHQRFLSVAHLCSRPIGVLLLSEQEF